MNDIDPQAWLADVLGTQAEHPARDIDGLWRVELRSQAQHQQPGRLIVAAISAVFTIDYVANLLGEDEDWLFDLSIGMEPEDGSLWVYGVGEDGVPAFTRDGIDNLRQIIADERAEGKAPPQAPPPN